MPMKASCDINYCVVDTIIDNGHLQFFWDRKYHFFLVRDNLHLEVMGVDFMNKLYDYELMEKGNWYDYKQYEYHLPSDKKNGKKTKWLVEVDFFKRPKYFIRFLVRGQFFVDVTYVLDDIYGKYYPFKDPNAFYLVYVPLWDDVK